MSPTWRVRCRRSSKDQCVNRRIFAVVRPDRTIVCIVSSHRAQRRKNDTNPISIQIERQASAMLLRNARIMLPNSPDLRSILCPYRLSPGRSSIDDPGSPNATGNPPRSRLSFLIPLYTSPVESFALVRSSDDDDVGDESSSWSRYLSVYLSMHRDYIPSAFVRGMRVT